ncbi:MAG: glycoside hydrolase family 10 protein [Anaerolineae bacterium]
MADTPLAGIALNEDDSHYFSTRAGQPLDATIVDSWVDQYANTQVRELMLCPNAMRTSYDSRVWDPIWRGYDPTGPDDQPLLASTAAADRTRARQWIHTAWQLAQMGIDPYERWINRARQVGISPWISTRMNDIHNVDDERSYIHSEFWRANPQLRRVTNRFNAWTDRALDFGRVEVREHHLSLIRELAERYDFDGLELDWMRFGFHLRPGHEQAGMPLLTQFTEDVRRILDTWQTTRGHRIRLSARVPSRPATSLGLGLDAATWARRGLVDMLVVTPFWATAETDMPIELWQQLLAGSGVALAAGLEILLRPYPQASAQTNSLETARGFAASMLYRSVDRIYLFNYMDSETAMDDLANYPTLLREIGSLATLQGKARRHVVTYADTWTPGEAQAIALPAVCNAHAWQAFRLPIGPRPTTGTTSVLLGVEGDTLIASDTLQVLVNGEPCSYAGKVTPASPSPDCRVYAYRVPLPALNDGYNLIEVCAGTRVTFGWVEISIQA